MAARKTGKLGKRAKTAPKHKGKSAEVNMADAVHQIWLAGMGALARAQKDGPKTFEKLIADGAKYINYGRNNAEQMLGQAIAAAQSSVGARMAATKDTATETWANLEALFQSRVEKVLHQAGIPSATEIRALTRRIDQLSAHVESLAKASPKAAPRKQARRKAARPTPAPEPASG